MTLVPGVRQTSLVTSLRILTRRERQVANAVFLGHSAKLIARQLGITEQGVRNYLRSIYDKTGMYSKLELFAFLRRHPAYLDAARGKEMGRPSQQAAQPCSSSTRFSTKDTTVPQKAIA